MIPTLVVTIKPKTKTKKFVVEMDAERFEKFAAVLGFFSQEFLESLENAERDARSGRVRRIRSLAELRNT